MSYAIVYLLHSFSFFICNANMNVDETDCYLSSDGLGINKLILHPTGMMESLECTRVLFTLLTYPQEKPKKQHNYVFIGR